MTADNVVKLGAKLSAPNPPSQNVIDELEDLLVRAKRGELRAIAYACVNLDRQTSTGWTEAPYSPEIMAAVCDLFYRFAMMRRESSEPNPVDSKPKA